VNGAYCLTFVSRDGYFEKHKHRSCTS